MVEAKRAFEAYAKKNNVSVKHYHADNGRFADNEFIKSVNSSVQTISYCGVNAHFQNGIAEKRIRDLQEQARKQLLHAKSRWPSAVELNLWPYALRNANELRNTLPDKEDGSSPIERFCQTNVSPKIKHNHTFGCPVYALHNRLQAGGREPKWNPRARLGINLGPSPRHASSVSLVLNLQTGLVSPQYHLQFDDFFETVRPSAGNPPTFSQWQVIAGLRPANRGKQPPEESGTSRQSVPMIPTADASPDETGTNEFPDLAPTPPDDNIQTQTDTDQTETTTPVADSNERTNVSRYGRVRRMTQRMRESKEQAGIAFQTYFEAMHEDDYLLQDEMTDPVAFLVKTNRDTMYFDQAMREPDADEFIKAAVKEINDHIENKHWELVPRSEVPKEQRILPAVWAMKRKRDIKTQRVYKHKARLNVHGGKQEYGVNYFETFAPVVTWVAVRIILILSILNKWHTRQVDFVLAYTQADIEFDMYMDLPKGIKTKYGDGKTHVLKLLKNLYGQKQAGRVWNQHLVDGLKSIGFQQSSIDECVFYRKNVIFVVYVDDGIFASPDNAAIDDAIRDLRNARLDLEDQGSLNDYLGVNIERLPDGKIKLSQPHLIDQIIHDTKISKRSAGKQTPAASTKLLRRDLAAPKFDGRFNYRSVIGQLNFLEKSTRPDIAYATHQVARFCEDPRATHGEAVERIAKYLRDTRTEGVILSPNADKNFEVFADADFAGNWYKPTAAEDPSTAKSRTGYVVRYAGCPVIWASKLQTMIALSSCEAEYISLSQALRDTIPMMSLIKEIRDKGFHVYSTEPIVHCQAFEDNSGALEIAKLPKLRPRTKHINVTYHHFREHVRKGTIQIYPIGTNDQIADIFTKPLPQNLFLKHRNKLLHF
jgi:hypothetical protein